MASWALAEMKKRIHFAKIFSKINNVVLVQCVLFCADNTQGIVVRTRPAYG